MYWYTQNIWWIRYINRNLLAHNNIDIKSIDDVIISSVVPNVMHALENFCIKYCEKKLMIVGPGIKTGLNIKIWQSKTSRSRQNSKCCSCHWEKYGSPLYCRWFFGTATTFCAISDRQNI